MLKSAFNFTLPPHVLALVLLARNSG